MYLSLAANEAKWMEWRLLVLGLAPGAFTTGGV